jgi:1-deoxy-D-xylulose-5-phosphate synthase
MTISAPMDEIELRNLMYTAQLGGKGPFSIRYPRGRGVYANWQKPFKEIEIGKGRQISKGDDIAILSIGHAGNLVKEAVARLNEDHVEVTHYDMRFLKPIDENILHKVGRKFKQVITVEDGTIVGGLGSTVLEFFSDKGYSARVFRLGIPDKFVEHGTQMELYKECGFDPESIYKLVHKLISSTILSNVS